MWEVNPGPLSNWREMDIPNQGMVAQRRGSETEPFCWLEEMSPPILRRCPPRTGDTQHICYGNVGKIKLPWGESLWPSGSGKGSCHNWSWGLTFKQILQEAV